MSTDNMATMRISKTNVSMKGKERLVKDIHKFIGTRSEIFSERKIDGHTNRMIYTVLNFVTL
jgi:hypothetical protein